MKSFTGEVLSLSVKCTIGKSTAHMSDQIKYRWPLFELWTFQLYTSHSIPARSCQNPDTRRGIVPLLIWSDMWVVNFPIVHLQATYIRKILWKRFVLNILWQMLQSYWRLHTPPHNVGISLDPSWVGHGSTNSLLDVKNQLNFSSAMQRAHYPQ